MREEEEAKARIDRPTDCPWCGAAMDRFTRCESKARNATVLVETYVCGARQWFWWIDSKQHISLMDPAHPCAFMSKEYRDITKCAREVLRIADQKAQESQAALEVL